jgi:hypothetical protein
MTAPAVACFVLPGPTPGDEALASIGAQTWPAEVEVVALRGPLDFALRRALDETTGGLIAFIAAGDEWLPEKLRLQLAAFAAAPHAGAVHADIQPVAADGAVERPSWFAASKLDAATGLGGVLAGRQPWLSSLVLRRALAERLLPLPAGAEALDSYVAARIAEVADLAFVPVPLVRVRMDGAAESRARFVPQLELVRREIRQLRWAIGALSLESLAPAELVAVRAQLDALTSCAAALTGKYRDPDVTVAHSHRVAWRRAMVRAGAARALGESLTAAFAYLAAGVADPFERHAREQLAAVVERLR